MFNRVIITALCFFTICIGAKAVQQDGTTKNSKILMLLPFGSPSHRNCFLPLAKALAERGHKFSYPFAHKNTLVFLSPSGVMVQMSAVLGNVINPSYVASLLNTNYPPFSMLGRWKNLLFDMGFVLMWRHWSIVPAIDKELSSRFDDFPGIAAIERNASLTLSNSHFSINGAIPLLPSQVEVGGMHCRPAQPLPKDLKDFIEGSGSEGVIYFSLGSVTRGNTMPEKYTKVFVEVFRKLKQRVVWKFESDIQNLPQNVMLKKWLPQQDILAHPKIRMFISHGGLLSVQESIYHGTPLLVMPIFGDQPKNAKFVEDRTFGVMLNWNELSPERLRTSIQELMENSVYEKTVSSVSKSFRDQPMSPLEKAIWWTEYVIRHKGAPQLISKGKDVSWFGYLYIDLIIALHLTVLVIYKVFKAILCKISGAKNNKKQVKYNKPTYSRKSKKE